MQYVFIRKHQKLQRHPIWKALHVPNSQESCIATVPKSQQAQPPSHLLNGKWVTVSFTRATTTHVCSMLLLMQHINPLTGVLQLESWLLLHRHFFWDKAPRSGKGGVERLFCLWLEIEMSPFGKIVFFLGTFHRLFLLCKIKRNHFWKDVRLDKYFQRNRNAQRSKNLQSFWFWVKENFLCTLKWIKTLWEFQKNIFLSVKVWKIWFVGAILTFWAFCFNILLGRHAQLSQKIML